jgi:hypothetical protein
LSQSGLVNWKHRIISLSGADLREADLSIADLRMADLQNTHLGGANLYGAGLRGADLRRADLRGADLSFADLREANLSNTYLRDAKLLVTNLSGAQGVTDKRSAECESLGGATMPNGQKYEDWLKDKESRGEYLTDHERAHLDWSKVAIVLVGGESFLRTTATPSLRRGGMNQRLSTYTQIVV